MTAIRPIAPAQPFDVARIRQDFPILAREVRGKRLVFLDSAASAQKPRIVIDAERRVYEAEYANVHRGVYWLSQRATDAFEAAREKVRQLLNAREPREIVFVRGATEAINLVAQSYGLSLSQTPLLRRNMALAGSRFYRRPHVHAPVSHPFGPFLPLSRPKLPRARSGGPPTPGVRAQAPTHWQTPDRFLGPASLGLVIQTLAAMP